MFFINTFLRRLILATPQSPLPQHYNSRLSGNKCHVFFIVGRVTCINADVSYNYDCQTEYLCRTSLTCLYRHII